ncbi:MAG: alpha-galactosidase [Lentisphaeria bacterium]
MSEAIVPQENGAQRFAGEWVAGVAGGGAAAGASRLTVGSRKQGWGGLRLGTACTGEPLRPGGRSCATGIGTHADSEIVLRSGRGITRLRAVAGVHAYAGTRADLRLVFAVEAGGAAVWTSAALGPGQPQEADIRFPAPAHEVVLRITSADGSNHWGHADWGDVQVDEAGDAPAGAFEIDPWSAQPIREVPFSFVYGGKPSAQLLREWPAVTRSTPGGRGETVHQKIWRDPAGGLECRLELRQFAAYPVAEWVVHFKNAGTADTPILENIRALDVAWRAVAPKTDAGGGEVTVFRSVGSVCRINDFEYLEETVLPGRELAMACVGGRSSDPWLPFWNLQLGGTLGVITAVGWTGQWAAGVCNGGDAGVHSWAGMEKTHLRLHPGEEIRTPRMAQCFWEGDVQEGYNVWRRFLLEHHVPRVNGEPIQAPLTIAHWGGMKTAGHLERLAKYQEQGLTHDFYWVDAGWYGLNSTYSPDEFSGDWAIHTGDWRVNPKAHPQGLKPLGEAVRKAGMPLMLWVEPERANGGTHWPEQHPEWFLGKTAEKGATLLLDLGNPAARRAATELVSTLIMETQAGCYRQDFNMDPLPYWRANDAEDRQGMTEIRHIEGLYAFWDELLARHPGLIIDNCSSGGRRIDLEMISRSIPMWRSDWQCGRDNDPVGGQVHGMGLSYWIPLHGTGTYNSMATKERCSSYRVRSNMGPSFMLSAFPYESTPIAADYPWDWFRQMVRDFRRAQPLFRGDYYPLTAARPDLAQWAVYQMHRPDLQEGFLMALRRCVSPWLSAQFPLRGLMPEAEYELTDADTDQSWRATGAALAKAGVEITLPERDSSRLIFYRRL